MRTVPALLLSIALLSPSPFTYAETVPPPAAPAADDAAAPAPGSPMMMRILDEKKDGAQIDAAERAEHAAERERRKEMESDLLKKGLRESIDLAVRLGLYAGTIVLLLIIAGAFGAVLAVLISHFRKRRESL